MSDEGHRQFDFWIGEWDVLDPKGRVVGHSRVEAILDGFVLLEHWTSAQGTNGKSFNRYDSRTDKWHQIWVDDQGEEINFYGGLDDGAMVLVSRGDKGSKKSSTRMTFTRLANGDVRQVWETGDATGSYAPLFCGRYVRKKLDKKTSKKSPPGP